MSVGVRKTTEDSNLINKFHLDGTPAATCGVPLTEATSDIDARKFLSVSAPDKFAGQSNQLTMYGGSRVLIPVSTASAGRQRTTIYWASFTSLAIHLRRVTSHSLQSPLNTTLEGS